MLDSCIRILQDHYDFTNLSSSSSKRPIRELKKFAKRFGNSYFNLSWGWISRRVGWGIWWWIFVESIILLKRLLWVSLILFPLFRIRPVERKRQNKRADGVDIILPVVYREAVQLRGSSGWATSSLIEGGVGIRDCWDMVISLDDLVCTPSLRCLCIIWLVEMLVWRYSVFGLIKIRPTRKRRGSSSRKKLQWSWRDGWMIGVLSLQQRYVVASPALPLFALFLLLWQTLSLAWVVIWVEKR